MYRKLNVNLVSCISSGNPTTIFDSESPNFQTMYPLTLKEMWRLSIYVRKPCIYIIS